MSTIKTTTRATKNAEKTRAIQNARLARCLELLDCAARVEFAIGEAS